MSSHAAKEGARQPALLDDVLRRGAGSLHVPPPRLAEFEMAMKEVLAVAHRRTLDVGIREEPSRDNKTTIRELREIGKSAESLLTVVMGTCQATKDALDRTFSIDDAAVPNFQRSVEYLIAVSNHALNSIKAPKRRGRKAKPAVGHRNMSLLDEFIVDVCLAVFRQGGQWRADKNNASNPAVGFLESLEGYLPPKFLVGLCAGRVYDLGRQTLAASRFKDGN